MKKIITASIMFLSLCLFCLGGHEAYAAQINMRSALTQIETGIYGYDRSNESDSARIERLEEYLYGQKKSGALSMRLEALLNDSGFEVQTQKPKEAPSQKFNTADSMPQTGRQGAQGAQGAQGVQSALQNLPNRGAQTGTPYPALKEDETAEYAIIDKMEKMLYNKTFKAETIYERLNRLENTVFQRTSSSDLSTRTDRLAEVLHPQGRQQRAYDNFTPEEIELLYNSSGMPQINDESLPFQLAVIENGLFKHDYARDNNAVRLSRLEQKLFSRTFQNDNDIQRIQRISAAYEAKKNSSMYENNRKMQNMAALSQIGGILLMILMVLL